MLGKRLREDQYVALQSLAHTPRQNNKKARVIPDLKGEGGVVRYECAAIDVTDYFNTIDCKDDVIIYYIDSNKPDSLPSWCRVGWCELQAQIWDLVTKHVIAPNDMSFSLSDVGSVQGFFTRIKSSGEHAAMRKDFLQWLCEEDNDFYDPQASEEECEEVKVPHAPHAVFFIVLKRQPEGGANLPRMDDEEAQDPTPPLSPNASL